MPQFNHELMYEEPRGFLWAQCFPDELQKQEGSESGLPAPPLPFTGPRSSATEEKKTLAKNKSANGSSQALCGHLKIERIQALSSFFFFYNKNKWEMEGE